LTSFFCRGDFHKHDEMRVCSPRFRPGKTTLIKALTGDGALQPRDQLFATLDVTVHAGRLPSHMTILYVDTIGFLSQLPHRLIDSFSATLEDIKHSVSEEEEEEEEEVLTRLVVSAGSADPRPRHQPPGDGEPEGQRAEGPGRHAGPRAAAALHDRSPQQNGPGA